jgi:hypothetical protein
VDIPHANDARYARVGMDLILENADVFHREHRGPAQGPQRQYLRTASFQRGVCTCAVREKLAPNDSLHSVLSAFVSVTPVSNYGI